MATVKGVTAGLVAGAVTLMGLLWAVSSWPDEAYDHGYARAFQSAWGSWMLTRPEDAACDRIVDDLLRVDAVADEVISVSMSPQQRLDAIARMHAGCVDGYRDGVNYRRVPLGLEPR